jgi:hypothetical protein
MKNWTDREISRLKMILETEQLHSVYAMAKLASKTIKGRSVVAISHKLREIISKKNALCENTVTLEDGSIFKTTIISGYVHIFIPDNNKLELLHHYVWKKINGVIPSGYHVHHINGDRLDNRSVNLQLMEASEHIRYHHSAKPAETSLMFAYLVQKGLWEDFLIFRNNIIGEFNV